MSLQTLEFATKAMFWDSQRDPRAPDRGIDESKHQPHTFTAGGALCQRVESSSEKQPLPGAQPVLLDPDHIWCLSRKPYIKTLPEPVCIFPPAELFEQKKAGKGIEESNESVVEEVNKQMEEKSNEEEGNFKSPQTLWQLWDGRYWIRLINPQETPMRIYPLSHDRLARLKAKLKANGDTESLKLLETSLEAIGPPHVRYTIPAIVDDEGNILALPTLHFRVSVSPSEVQTRKASSLKWHVRYKRVVFPNSVRQDRIIALKDERLEGAKVMSRVAEEEERDKPRAQKKLEQKERKKRKAHKTEEWEEKQKERQKKGKLSSFGVRKIYG